MGHFRQISKQVGSLPPSHQVLFWLSAFMLLWQCLYLTRFFGDALYRAIEKPVSPPSQCELVESKGSSATGMKPGEVSFSVDMRCTEFEFEGVFVTSPMCGGCGPEGWNELHDKDKDGVYEGKIEFIEALTDAPMVGMGISYRYGVSIKSNGGPRLTYPENLLLSSGEESMSCAPSSDGRLYAYRVLVTDQDGTEVKDIFGSCGSVEMPNSEWTKIKDAEWASKNEFLVKKVDPWWKPTSEILSKTEVISPVLFLTICTFVYVYSVLVVFSGYASRKERDLQVALDDAKHKNTYLEHAAKILRHDMNSGINIYMPRGIKSLQRRLDKGDPELVKSLRLDAPLRMLNEGLAHTQKVYAGVTVFTNLVKQGAEIEKQPHNLGEILASYLDTTEYKSEVIIGELPTIEVNEPLFCTAIDNLIRNGLKYNDSPSKMVIVNMLDEHHLGVIDNGRGMTHEEFLEYSKPYTRKSGQEESGTGLGLNICIAILREHGFTVTASKRDEGGTTIKVKII
jgi:hypothetical protein